MNWFFEAFARAWLDLRSPDGVLFFAFLWSGLLTVWVAVIVRRWRDPDFSRRRAISWSLWSFGMASLNLANSMNAAHVHYASFSRPICVAAAAGVVMGLAGPSIARVLRLPQLAQAVAAVFTPVPAVLAWLSRPLFTRIIRPIADRLKPHLSAFRVAMFAVLSLCAGLVGMVALSFVRS